MEKLNDNKAAVLYGKLDLRLEQRERPVPGKNEVVIEMKSCGICGTDLHMWTEGCCGTMTIDNDRPVVIGHESSGVVHSVGDSIYNLKVGDRVALELGLPCRNCDLCKRGKYNLCKGFSLGALTQYHCYAADFCHKLPANVSFEEGAMIEPLAVAVRACKRAGVTLGSTVLVCGAGCIGLCVTMVAKAKGAAKICITDLASSRLRLAQELGATYALLIDERGATELATAVAQQLGEMPDCTIECTGVKRSLEMAIYATKSGGVVSPVGLGEDCLQLPVVNAAIREVDIKGVFSYCNDYQPAISLIANGRVRPAPVITHHFDLTDILKAFDFAKCNKDEAIKVMINCTK